MEKLPPDSDIQQSKIESIKDEDGYNWGYRLSHLSYHLQT